MANLIKAGDASECALPLPPTVHLSTATGRNRSHRSHRAGEIAFTRSHPRRRLADVLRIRYCVNCKSARVDRKFRYSSPRSRHLRPPRQDSAGYGRPEAVATRVGRRGKADFGANPAADRIDSARFLKPIQGRAEACNTKSRFNAAITAPCAGTALTRSTPFQSLRTGIAPPAAGTATQADRPSLIRLVSAGPDPRSR